jgi:N-formylglutamate amidohydrolase
MQHEAFAVSQPRGVESAVVVEVPHAGVDVDPESMATLAAPVHALGRDADLHVDDLFCDAPDLGATLIVARLSRYICDLNRAESDVDALTVVGGSAKATGHGLIWRLTTDQLPALLHPPLPSHELDRRIRDFYRPYHQAVRSAIAAKRERFGHVILLCAHSMPSTDAMSPGRPSRPLADIVPGSRGRTSTSERVLTVVEQLARSRGWSVSHDDPYAGGYSTAHYGRPKEHVHAVQVELGRPLYMDETTFVRKRPGWAATRAFCHDLVAALGALAL